MQTTRASFHTSLLTSAAKMAAPMAAACLALAALAPAEGATYVWNPAGAGDWNLDPATQRFLDGLTPTSWFLVNLNPDEAEAYFAGVGGVISVGDAIRLNRLTIKSNGYSLVGTGGNLEFVGPMPTIWIDPFRTLTSTSVTISATTLTLDGGGTFRLGSSGPNGTGLISDTTDINLLTGTTMDLSLYSEAVGAFTLTNGSIIGSGSLTASSYDLRNGTVNAVLAGENVNLEKGGGGTVTLRKANTFTGSTVVSGGLLALTGSNALEKSSSVTVSVGTLSIAEPTVQHMKQVDISNGGRLELFGGLATDFGMRVSGLLTGDGDARGSAVTIGKGGVIEPGPVGQVGMITTGNLTLNGGGTYTWQIDSLSGGPSSDWDLINVIGNLSIPDAGNRFTLDVIGLGDKPVPLSAGTVSWMIANYYGLLSYSGTDLNSHFDIQLGGTWVGLPQSLFSITNENNALYLTMAPVPEPKDYAMILGAITLGLVGYRRWRRSAQLA